MTTLEVSFVKLSECLVSPGWRLALGASETPGLHYNISGMGRIIIDDHPPIDLVPHTLVIVPSKTSFVIEGPGNTDDASGWKTAEGTLKNLAAGVVRRFVAGEGEPRLILICGYFRALYGTSLDLFGSLTSPIVEQFDAADELEQKFKSVLAELLVQEVGMGAMTAALMKLVLVPLLRRSLSSRDVWVERFSMLGDPQIARAFADMAARPSASHTVQSLSYASGLSRSAFMARFAAAFGQAPMAVLRQLRMRHAAALVAANSLSIEQIAHKVGYKSRSSFSRAFRKAYGSDPTQYRDAAQRSPEGEANERYFRAEA